MTPTDSGGARQTASGWMAAGGVLGAFAAASCCVVPLVLVTLGVSGAWIGSLTSLEPFKPYFIAVAAVLLGIGFWSVYLRPKPACEEGSYCARPLSSVLTQIGLWTGAIVVVLAATIDIWAPLFY